MRMPDINEELVVFVYAGDIWRVSADGGYAVRLTSHEGMEIFPKISPDKKWIAFSGEYSGSRQIYIMPIQGGTPQQLTYYNDAGVMPPRGGWDHIPMDWTADSQKILIRANRTPYGIRMGKYFLVDINGGLETPLQIPEAGFGTFSPDEKSLVYTPISREFRTWKRTKGGRAADIWIYNLEKDTSQRLTTFTGTDHLPLWYKDKIYFVSDRDLTLDIYSYNLGTGDIAQITKFDDYDVLWPSGHGGKVIFEKGGYLFTLDLDTGKTIQLEVNINFDNPNRLPYYKNVSRFISRFGAAISPDGNRAVFDGRGDLFSVPAKSGVTLNLTQTQGIREKYPSWSPDGKSIAYISDESGDYEIYIRDPQGKKDPVQLTKDNKVWKYPVDWSPDSKWLLFSDANRKLQLLNVESKEISLVAKGEYSDIGSYEWSPDSKWIVYNKTESNRLDAIWVYSLEKKESYKLSEGNYNDYSPSFSRDGKHLFFLSNRDFNMSFQTGFSSMEFDFVYNQTTRIYAMGLVKDAPDLFKEENDLEEKKQETPPAKAEPEKKEEKKESEEKKEEKLSVKIDLEGINNRITVFPLPTSNYGMVYDLGGGKVLYFRERQLRYYDLKEKKDNLVIEGIGNGVISSDNKKLLYSARGQWGIIDIRPDQKVGTGTLNLSGMDMKIDPIKEWNQIFHEGWRIFRDWFYVTNMHGVDWEKMEAKYSKLLPYVSYRADLDYIFGEMVGELNVGHTYVNWGDFKRVERLDTGLLGAELIADPDSKLYKISKIYDGENWNDNTRSPLTEPGIDINVGDYIIQLNGHSLIRKSPLQSIPSPVPKELRPTG
jgi:tricorn protease